VRNIKKKCIHTTTNTDVTLRVRDATAELGNGYEIDILPRNLFASCAKLVAGWS